MPSQKCYCQWRHQVWGKCLPSPTGGSGVFILGATGVATLSPGAHNYKYSRAELAKNTKFYNFSRKFLASGGLILNFLGPHGGQKFHWGRGPLPPLEPPLPPPLSATLWIRLSCPTTSVQHHKIAVCSCAPSQPRSSWRLWYSVVLRNSRLKRAFCW